MSQKVRLGRIERVPVREVWPNEALDFTRWLAREENLSELGEACSLDLEPVDTESSVGSFSVDIFARETDSNRKVVVENQLEDTDHDHLGKIITYTAGKGADVAIWVVAHARDEHRKAVEWLNEHTDDECAFFLVEVEVWRIGGSDMAPRFNVVESPNEWVRAERAKDGLSETDRAKLEYWQLYRERALENSAFSRVMRRGKRNPSTGPTSALGRRGIRFAFLLIPRISASAWKSVCAMGSSGDLSWGAGPSSSGFSGLRGLITRRKHRVSGSIGVAAMLRVHGKTGLPSLTGSWRRPWSFLRR